MLEVPKVHAGLVTLEIHSYQRGGKGESAPLPHASRGPPTSHQFPVMDEEEEKGGRRRKKVEEGRRKEERREEELKSKQLHSTRTKKLY